ncbi:Ig-like domain-containing protein [uncultured Methanobrevibacter sp.]|uniref:Ig-like domain-containing protein n=1 Tax=uncultured Methanobrevibacter sp. TaxID=253161 RepID=UPI0025D60BD0|nr:Ig-like domain-containing protein [uncultured Methanobrevibacter sp.]
MLLLLGESGDSSVYSISLPVDATGTFTVCVDGVNYTATLVDGKASVNVSDLSEGSHNITVTYSGDAKYSPIVKSSVITIAPPVKLAGSNLSMLYTSGKYYKVRLTQGDLSLAGKKVKIIINSKTYTRTTDVNGYASVKISLPPKTYKAQAFYGDLKATNKVVVKSIISAKNINAKKSAKSIMIKVTLKKVNNKYLKNKKVTLKFNKKTFKARTNKKGVVTFTIKKNVYNKLKVGKKYSYQVTYVKSTVKKTIKLK